MADEQSPAKNAAGDGPLHAVVCWLAPPDPDSAALAQPPFHPLAEALAIGVSAGRSAPELPESIKPGAAVQLIELPPAATLAHLCNRAAARWPDADLALVFSDAVLPDSWLERLGEALEAESTAATASALLESDVAPRESRRDSMSPPANRSMSSLDRPSDWAGAVAQASAQLRPRLRAVVPTCVYVRRSALDLVGPLDETLCSSYAAVLDFALRARRRGLGNLLADDLLVSAPPAELDEADERVLQSRHPTLMRALEQPEGPAVERSLTLASVALEPLRVTVDARALGPQVGGTQVYLLRLLESLASGGEVQVRALVPSDLAASIQARLRGLARTQLLTYEQALEHPEPSHVVHRPQQAFSADDLVLLRPLGKRMVITHQDLIAYHNPTYFPSFDLWERFVRTARHALAVADHVLFFSWHALLDAEHEDLIERSRSSVAYLGVDLDELHGEASVGVQPPRDAPSLASAPFLLCIGADYRHKNRAFALAVLDELRRRHGWPGMLVLAGPHVEHGSSAVEEREVRARFSIAPELAIDLAAVSERDRLWLMSRAAAVVYPTVHEGFGLVPFESATFGVPCLFAALSSLNELFDAELATLVPWDPRRSAERAAPLLTEGADRRRHVDGLLRAARARRWDACASATVDAYRAAISAPYRASAQDAWQALEREREVIRLDRGIDELNARVRQLSDDLGEDALALVGPHALLSRSDQHVLLAVAARPALRRLVLGVLRGAFRSVRAVTRRRG